MICAKRENKNAGDGVRILNIITLNHRRAESVIMYYIKSVRLIRLRVVSGCYYVYYRLYDVVSCFYYYFTSMMYYNTLWGLVLIRLRASTLCVRYSPLWGGTGAVCTS